MSHINTSALNFLIKSRNDGLKSMTIFKSNKTRAYKLMLSASTIQQIATSGIVNRSKNCEILWLISGISSSRRLPNFAFRIFFIWSKKAFSSFTVMQIWNNSCGDRRFIDTYEIAFCFEVTDFMFLHCMSQTQSPHVQVSTILVIICIGKGKIDLCCSGGELLLFYMNFWISPY